MNESSELFCLGSAFCISWRGFSTQTFIGFSMICKSSSVVSIFFDSILSCLLLFHPVGSSLFEFSILGWTFVRSGVPMVFLNFMKGPNFFLNTWLGFLPSKSSISLVRPS